MVDATPQGGRLGQHRGLPRGWDQVRRAWRREAFGEREPFAADASYAFAIGRDRTRAVSCDTNSILRTLTALKRAGHLGKARGVPTRRATDPWVSYQGGIVNTLAPEPSIPFHQGPDAQSVDPDLVTMVVKVAEALGHLRSWTVQLTRPADREEVRVPSPPDATS